MIARAVLKFAETRPQSTGLITSAVRRSYAELATTAGAVAEQLKDCAGMQVGVWFQEVDAMLATLFALDSLGADVVILPSSATLEQAAQRAAELLLSTILTNQASIDRAIDTDHSLFRPVDFALARLGTVSLSPSGSSQKVVLFTSGTSGQPKAVIHSWKNLAAGVNFDSRYSGRRWLLAYDPTSFAGIQVWLQALLTGGCVCLPESRDPGAIAEFMTSEQVEFASATPSFWRLLLHSAATQELSQSALTQITIGGEAVDQPLLDSLHQAFPHARITHIYASTEMGVCFSVSDGCAGFPADYLLNPALPCQLRIGSEGELEILSRRKMFGYFADQTPRSNGQLESDSDEAHWFATGDVVQRQGDRIYFVGRKSDTINVGGAKVFPADVERCISSVPGVEQVRVFGIPSSLAGQLVAAEVQPSEATDPETLRTEILTACREKLARHQVPARVSFCSQLPTNASGKLVRKEVLNGG